LLTRLQRAGVCGGGAFRVHSEPNGPDNYTDNTSGDVLSGFPALLIRQFLGFSVIGFNFRSDHRAVGIHVLRLHACNGCWIAPRAGRQCEADGYQ
jgi:hypothetical protein